VFLWGFILTGITGCPRILNSESKLFKRGLGKIVYIKSTQTACKLVYCRELEKQKGS
jgi:hypothetical protein